MVPLLFASIKKSNYLGGEGGGAVDFILAIGAGYWSTTAQLSQLQARTQILSIAFHVVTRYTHVSTDMKQRGRFLVCEV